MNLYQELKELGACSVALAWAEGKSAEQAFKQCDNVHWLLWLLEVFDHEELAEELRYDSFEVCGGGHPSRNADRADYVRADPRAREAFRAMGVRLEEPKQEVCE